MGTLSTRLSTYALVLLFALSSGNIHAQIFYELTEEDVIAELEKKGLEYEEVRIELFKNGIDITTLESQDVTMEQVQIIERVILELEKRKLQRVMKSALERN